MNIMNYHRYILLIFLSVLVPFFFYLEVFVLLPELEKEVTVAYIFHFVYALFALLNVVGNIVFAILTDTSIRANSLHLQVQNNETSNGWRYCPECRCECPPRSWHCKTCQICILKRDHHCEFIGFCIGYYNYRYFLMFLVHVFVALMYSMILNFKLFCDVSEWNIYTIFKIVSPILIAQVGKNIDLESFCIIALLLNVVFGLFTGYLMYFHIHNALYGQTSKEASLNDDKYNLGFKTNLVECLGSKWGLALVSPFIYSPLPGDGTSWACKTT